MNQPFLGGFPGRQPSPFLGSDALSSGVLTVHQLRKNYRAVYRNVYLAKDVALSPLLRAQAAWLFTGPDAVLSGISAAAVHGTQWLNVNAPAEVVRANCHAPDGLRVRSYALAPELRNCRRILQFRHSVPERHMPAADTAARKTQSVRRSLVTTFLAAISSSGG